MPQKQNVFKSLRVFFFGKSRRDTNTFIVCLMSVCAYLGAVSGSRKFRSNMFGLAQHRLVNVKGKPERKSQKCNKASACILVDGLQHTLTKLLSNSK